MLASLALATGAAWAQRPHITVPHTYFATVDTPTVALVHARVIDGTGGPVREDQTVIVHDGKLIAVGPSSSTVIPTAARVIDLTGKTVLPGLVGLHDHTYFVSGKSSTTQADITAPLLYLAAGVTTIRTTGAYNADAEFELKRDIDAGRTLGPDIVLSGPYIQGAGVQGIHMRRIDDPAAARRLVNYWSDEGVRWFKLYSNVSMRVARAVIETAHQRGRKVSAHLCSLTFRDALGLGVDGIEHGIVTSSDFAPDKRADECPDGQLQSVLALDLSSEQAKTLRRDLIRQSVPVTSTLAVYESGRFGMDSTDQRVLAALSPEARTDLIQYQASFTDPARALVARRLRVEMQFERAFVAEGGLLAAGADPVGKGVVFGYADQRNVELLVEAGFSPVDAVKIATLNGARVLGLEREIGSIEVGKRANLVVVKGNPSAAIADIRNVETVFLNGIGYSARLLTAATASLLGVR